MQRTHQRCQYATLRYQPDEERGEFINVCLLVWDPTSKALLWNYSNDSGHLRPHFCRANAEEQREVKESLDQALSLICDRLQETDPTQSYNLAEIIEAASSNADLPHERWYWSPSRVVLERTFAACQNRVQKVNAIFQSLSDRILGRPAWRLRPEPRNICRLCYLLVLTIIGIYGFGWNFLPFALLLGINPELFTGWLRLEKRTTPNPFESPIPTDVPGQWEARGAWRQENEGDDVLSQEFITE